MRSTGKLTAEETRCGKEALRQVRETLRRAERALKAGDHEALLCEAGILAFNASMMVKGLK